MHTQARVRDQISGKTQVGNVVVAADTKALTGRRSLHSSGALTEHRRRCNEEILSEPTIASAEATAPLEARPSQDKPTP
jgi:hypothetical protein